jgi:hypothetical protein
MAPGESTTIRFIVGDIFHQIGLWFRSGVAPPSAQRKSVWLMLFFNFVGFAVLTLFLMAFFQVKFVGTFTSIVPLAFTSFLFLCPGLYGLWVSLASWRNVSGYDWRMLPNFD